MRQNQVYAYVRVSTSEQNIDRQLAPLAEMNILKHNIFIDYQSGKDFNRPQYKRLIKKLKEGDLLIIHSIDRLGRNYEEILEQWRLINKKKLADIRVLDMPLLDTTAAKDLLGTLISDLVLQLLSFVAQYERENIRTRQREGIEAAKKKGVLFGRRAKSLPDDFEAKVGQWREGKLSLFQLLYECEISESTFFRRIRK